MLPLSAIHKIKMGTPPSYYATSSCLEPKRVMVRLSEDASQHYIYCNCGKCLRCQDNKRNEMASRMFLHSLNFEYCYYVTLTYGSYNLLTLHQHPFLADWLQTVPSYDNVNQLGKYAWTPSILVQSHLTKFIKRLRKQLGFDISYASCGEYGSTYGRPHFHLIIWSHNKICKEQIEDAWSFDCCRTKNKLVVKKWRGASDSFRYTPLFDRLYRHFDGNIPTDVLKANDPNYFKFRIGRIDFNDLWANGSLNYDGKHPGLSTSQDGKHNAMYNFTYVAKYLGKSNPMDYLSNLPNIVKSRIERAFAFYILDSDNLYEKYPNPKIEDLQVYSNILKRINLDNYEFKNVDKIDFNKIVAPFFGSSRRPALGKHYFLQNRQRFLTEVPTLPSFMGKPLTIPSYFTRLIQQERYPLRLRKNCPSGISPTKDLLPRLYEYMSNLREDSRYWFSVRGYVPPTWDFQPRFDLYTLDGTDANGTLDSVDFLDASDTVLHYYYNPYDEIFEGYKFDPTIKDYVFVEYLDRLDFCDMVMTMIEKELSRFPEKLDRLLQRTDLMDCILSDPDTYDKIEAFKSQRKQKDIIHKILTPKLF